MALEPEKMAVASKAGQIKRSSLFDMPPKRERGESQVFASQADFHPSKPKTSYEHTYRLEVSRLFPISKAKVILMEEMNKMMGSVKTYDEEQAKELAKNMSITIRDRLRSLRYKRYRFVVNVHVGMREHCSIFIGTRFVWNNDQDNWTSYSITRPKVFAVAEVYAVTQE